MPLSITGYEFPWRSSTHHNPRLALFGREIFGALGGFFGGKTFCSRRLDRFSRSGLLLGSLRAFHRASVALRCFKYWAGISGSMGGTPIVLWALFPRFEASIILSRYFDTYLENKTSFSLHRRVSVHTGSLRPVRPVNIRVLCKTGCNHLFFFPKSKGFMGLVDPVCTSIECETTMIKSFLSLKKMGSFFVHGCVTVHTGSLRPGKLVNIRVFSETGCNHVFFHF